LVYLSFTEIDADTVSESITFGSCLLFVAGVETASVLESTDVESDESVIKSIAPPITKSKIATEAIRI
jgi:hypothetical protein